MDLAAFKRFLLVQRKRSLVTAVHLVKGVRRLTNHGLDLSRFQINPNLESETYLAQRLEKGASVFAYNNDVYVLTALADYLQLQLDVKPQQQPKTAPRFIPPDQLKRLLSYHAKGSSETNRLRRAMIHLMRHTGLRPSESVRLTVHDLRPITSTVVIKLSSKRGITGEIPVPRSLWRPRSPVMAYLRHRPQRFGDKLWVTKAAGPLTQWTYEKHLLAVSKELGFRVTHTFLRHTIATELHRKYGMDALFIRLFLRHRHVTASLSYVETNHDDLIRKYHQKRS